MIRGISASAGAIFLGAFLWGCSPAQKRADLIFINGAEPETLDPALITGQPEGRVVNALFEGLLRWNRYGKSEPGVASSWEISSFIWSWFRDCRTHQQPPKGPQILG